MSVLKPTCNADFFSKQYFDRAIKECPKLATLSGKPLNDYMLTVLAFNLSYNAFYRGKRQTAMKLLKSVLNSTNLSDRVHCAAALLEIQICVELNYLKLAQNFLHQLSTHHFWKSAGTSHKECFELLSVRCKALSSHQSSLEADSLHWFLFECEQQLKSGDSRSGLHSLFNRRENATESEKRILDNAIGCVFAFFLKDCNMAESYFRSAILKRKSNKDVDAMPILSSTLLYHTALSQLGSGKPKSAGLLFTAIWPFFCENARIWLRISECCVHNKLGDASSKEDEALFQAAKNGWNVIKEFSFPKCIDVPSTVSCSFEFAAFSIHQGLSIALSQKDFAYLLPYFYSLYAFVNIRLKRYSIALKAASDLLNLPQINPRQKLMGMFYKTETLVCLNRLQSATSCLQQATPLQSITYTFSRIVYNRALLEALNGEYERSVKILNELKTSGNGIVPRPEANLLRMYLDMQLHRSKIAKQVFKSAAPNFSVA